MAIISSNPSVKIVSPHTLISQATVTVPNRFVKLIAKKVAQSIQQNVTVSGFPVGKAPLEYIEQQYESNILSHTKEFLFKYFVIGTLLKELQKKKIIIAGEPRLTKVTLALEQSAEYQFDISSIPPVELKEWKCFSFKAPKRKRYKDIDRQVDLFISEENELKKNNTADHIQMGDWVQFDVTLVDTKTQKPLLDHHKESLWLKIADEEADESARTMFVGKQVGNLFYADNHSVLEHFGNRTHAHHLFLIEIQTIVPHHYFCFDDFKKHFRVKTQKDMHQKLIEVFSFRNDLSQRCAMVEESFKLLLGKHRLDIPHSMHLRQQKTVLQEVKRNPDYPVYKTEPEFENFIKQLAIKQLKEMILTDTIAFREDIVVSAPDIKNYLNLLKRPRTKEFIYFKLPQTKVDGHEMPLPDEVIRRSCLREKTLNYVIHHLMGK